MRPHLIALPLLLPLWGCGHPDAPKNLNELCGYLYEHFDDDDTAEEEAGLTNLYDWLHRSGNLESTFEGYKLTNALSDAAVDVLDDNAHSVTGAAGAAVGTSGKRYSQHKIVETLINVDPNVLSPGMYTAYQRTYLSDPDCFISKDCERLEVHNEMTNSYNAVITEVEVSTATHGQYRWFDWNDQQVMVQRTWMEQGADVSVDWLSVSDQYYLNIVYPETKGTLRLQSTWIVAEFGDSPVPEDIAISMVISSMQQVYEDIETYLDEH